MRIGLNLTFVTGGGGGASRYVRELVPALRTVAPELSLTVFVGAEAPPEFVDDPRSKGTEWVRLPIRTANRTHLIGQFSVLPVLAAKRRLHVLHSPANIGPLITPGVARVVTLLDVIWLHQGPDWEAGTAARGFAYLSRRAALNADRVVAISEAARDDIVASLGIRRDRVDVTPLGVRIDPATPTADAREVRARFDLGDAEVILSVAQKRPYKNLASLVRALPHLRDAVLVLPGFATPHEQELRELAQALGVSARVRFPSWVSEPELEGLYRVASVFALPSLIEGFGLPVLEAMGRGVPVACSDRPALPEVAGDAALLFDPERQEDVTGSLRRLLEDRALAARLVERGRRRVRLFSWERTAEATVAAYRRALAQRV